MRELIAFESATHERFALRNIFPYFGKKQGGGVTGWEVWICPDASAADEAGAVTISLQIPHVKHE
jgi:hypothetical protein